MQAAAIELKVRRAHGRDARILAEIENEAILERTLCFSEDLRTEPVQRLWIENTEFRFPILVLEDKNHEVVGWARIISFGGSLWQKGIAECSICIRKKYRGNKYGRYLLDKLLSTAESLNYRKMIANVFSFNDGSRSLFESSGFREVGIYSRHGLLDGLWVDVVIYEIPLPRKK